MTDFDMDNMDREALDCAAAMVAVISQDVALARLTREGERLARAHGRRLTGEISGEITDSEEHSLKSGRTLFLHRIAAVLGTSPRT